MNVNRMSRFVTYATFVLLIVMTLGSCASESTGNISSLPEKDQTLLSDKSKNYKTLSVGQFKIHYQADSYSASQKETLEQEVEYALSRTLQVLEIPSFDKEVHFILFPSKAEMNAHLGELPIRHYVKPDDYIGYFVHNEDFRPYFTQNLFQLIAIDNWGKPKGIMLAIGGSIFADARCQDVRYFLDEIGASLIRSGNLMSYRAMFQNFYPALEADPILAEVQAAAFYQFVQDNFGVAKVRELWKYGMTRLEGVIFLTPSEIEKEIFGRWRNYTPTQEVDWEKIEQYGC